MAMFLATTPVLAAETVSETEYKGSVSNETEENSIEDDSTNFILDENILAEEADGENLEEGLLVSEPYLEEDRDSEYNSSDEENQTDDLVEENIDDEELDGGSDEEEDADSDYGIMTLAKVGDGFQQDADSGDWYYYVDGKIDTSRNDVIYGSVDSVTAWWYVVGGKVQLTFTGLADYSNANGWWYIKNGKVDFTVNTVAQNKNGWYYVENGKVDFSYNGFATNSNGKWYIENGKVTFNKNSVIKDTTGAIGSKGTWWYVVGSKVQSDFTGLADYSNENGWWYVEDGKVTFTKDAIAKNKNGWYYVKDSKVDFSFTGLADFKNENGWWYIENGKVTFSKDTVAKNKNGWYYIKDSKVDFSFTGLADFSNENGWWYIEDGKVTFTYNGVEKNKNGWYYIKDSKVDFSYNGFEKNSNGSWYIENGKVTFSKNSVIKDTDGAIGTEGIWYYVVGSKVQYDFTGLANYSNANGWWYIKNGVVDFTANTVAQNNNGWYYVEGGKVIFSFNGIAKNSNGWWYIKDGKVDFSYNGKITVSAGTYTVVNGQVQNVNVSDSVSSEIKDVEDSGESEGKYDYTVPEEYITYSGTDTNQLSAPRFTGTVNNSGTMTLTWEPVSGAEKYLVLRKKYGDSNWTELATTTATTYTDNKYPGETDVYFYSVCCVNAAGTKHTSPYISSFSGSAVAEYGQLFVGRPYVWGGTSLINGCDCSGFVMQVYAHFGVLMYHYSGAQRQIGAEVSYENVQPGDIMGYDGHTGIYIGNGEMVHASNAIDGIKISEVNTSRSGFGVRRIF